MGETMTEKTTFYALLTLDLKDLPDTTEGNKKRDSFYAELKKRRWAKLNDLSTAWSARFTDGWTYKRAVCVTIDDIASAAKLSNVSKWSVAVQVGNNKRVEFNHINYQKITREFSGIGLTM